MLYDDVDSFIERQAPLRETHPRLVRKALERGDLWPAGALAHPVDGAVLVFSTEERFGTERVARSDPYVTVSIGATMPSSPSAS